VTFTGMARGTEGRRINGDWTGCLFVHVSHTLWDNWGALCVTSFPGNPLLRPGDKRDGGAAWSGLPHRPFSSDFVYGSGRNTVHRSDGLSVPHARDLVQDDERAWDLPHRPA